MAALADVFDAPTSAGPCKKAWTFDKAIRTIREDPGIHYDPEVFEAFLKGTYEIKEVYERHQIRKS